MRSDGMGWPIEPREQQKKRTTKVLKHMRLNFDVCMNCFVLDSLWLLRHNLTRFSSRHSQTRWSIGLFVGYVKTTLLRNLWPDEWFFYCVLMRKRASTKLRRLLLWWNYFMVAWWFGLWIFFFGEERRMRMCVGGLCIEKPVHYLM